MQTSSDNVNSSSICTSFIIIFGSLFHLVFLLPKIIANNAQISTTMLFFAANMVGILLLDAVKKKYRKITEKTTKEKFFYKYAIIASIIHYVFWMVFVVSYFYVVFWELIK